MSGAAKLWAFLRAVFAPGLHLAFAGAWVASLAGSQVLLRAPGGPAWRLDLDLVLAVSSVLLVLFFLRVVDEVKDEEYDRVHNPDRLLVRGVVTRRDLLGWGAGSAALALGLGGWLGARSDAPWLAAILALDLAWGVFLLRLEAWSSLVREGMFANLAVTYPVNVALSVYVVAYVLSAYPGLDLGAGDVLLVVAFALAFLHYEVARKTSWPEHSQGERMYSHALGARGALALVVACALGAAGVCLALFRPWEAGLAPRALGGWLVLLLPAVAGLMTRKLLAQQDRRVKLGGLGMIGLTVFYAALLLQALAGNTLAGPA